MPELNSQQAAPVQLPEIEEAERSVAPWFSLPYEEQLQRKQQMLQEILDGPYRSRIQPIIPSPRIVGHRNKMEFSFGYNSDEKSALGFHQRSKFWRVEDLNRSTFLTEVANHVYAEIKYWAIRTGLPFYRQVQNQGFFRYLIIREGKRTGEVLVSVVVNPSGFEREMSRVTSELVAIAQRCPAITSLWLTYRRSVGDAAVGEQSELIAGAPVIREQVLDLTFQISPASFFQVNTFGAEVIYDKLRELSAELPQRQTLVDLYCGSGGIALTLSRLFTTAIGIDSDRESIRLAVENAKTNWMDNAIFICAQAKQAMHVASLPNDLLVVDPPRAGLPPKVVNNVLRMAPRHLIYISCNPRSFRENLRALRRQFHVEAIIPVDLFPHTPHIELIASLVSMQPGR
jgi:23S rRNA (uracil1939-C5)-methyltransferase